MSNSGMKWTKEEERILLEKIKLGYNFSVIAEKHNRSEIAIHLRFANIVNLKLKNNQSIQSIANELNLTVDSIQNILHNAESYTNNKNSNDSTKKNFNITSLEEKLNKIEQKIDNIEKFCKSIYKKITQERQKHEK